MINKIYIGSPFFNEQQLKVIEDIKAACDSLEIPYFSPKDANLFKKTDPPEKAKECFDGNIKAMNECDLMIAVIDDFDAGTMFEMGYTYNLGNSILAYSDVPGRKMNLMLSQSCIGFANGRGELVDKLVRIKSDNFEPEKFKGENI